MKKLSTGFTLVEVLVVISIIAVLAALLFPVFSAARKSARTTVCMSNIRQIGMGVLIYTGDSNDVYPTSPVCSGESGNLQRLVECSWARSTLQYVKSWDVYLCPNAPFKDRMAYGINAYLLLPVEISNLENTLPTGYGSLSPLSSSSIERPASTVLIAEMEQGPDESGYALMYDRSVPQFCRSKSVVVDSGSPFFSGEFSTRHDGGGSIIFIDGHTRSKVKRNVFANGPDGGYWQPFCSPANAEATGLANTYWWPSNDL